MKFAFLDLHCKFSRIYDEFVNSGFCKFSSFLSITSSFLINSSMYSVVLKSFASSNRKNMKIKFENSIKYLWFPRPEINCRWQIFYKYWNIEITVIIVFFYNKVGSAFYGHLELILCIYFPAKPKNNENLLLIVLNIYKMKKMENTQI